MTATDFDYELPPHLIAQAPADRRDASRLLVYHRDDARVEHRQFTELIDYVKEGDVLVLNDSKVLRARVRGRRPGSGGAFELLLLEENSLNDWWVMLRPGRRAHPTARIDLLDRNACPTSIHATVLEQNDEGHRRLRFEGTPNILTALDHLGEMPVPPYIRRGSKEQKRLDDARYQTVYADAPGSVAAPTAGLHFTPEMLEALGKRGIEIVRVTLHVGVGTFAPVKVTNLVDHRMHEERFFLDKEAIQTLQTAKRQGRRVVAVGTTTLRALESGPFLPGAGKTCLFVRPPHPFQLVDALLTNFHLPRSTLLMLVSAFATPGSIAGTARILGCYREAIRLEYRFFSYGDAMLLL